MSPDRLKTSLVGRSRSVAALVGVRVLRRFQASFSSGMSADTSTSAHSGRPEDDQAGCDEGGTVRVVHLRVQRQVVLVCACRRPSV